MCIRDRFQAGFDKLIQIAVEHALCIADFDVGAQILDARLVDVYKRQGMRPRTKGLGSCLNVDRGNYLF